MGQSYYFLIEVGGQKESIPSNEDLNNYTIFGNYNVDNTVATSINNIPTTVGGRLEVKPYMSTTIMQMFFAYIAPPKVFMRRRTAGGTWSEWFQFSVTAV